VNRYFLGRLDSCDALWLICFEYLSTAVDVVHFSRSNAAKLHTASAIARQRIRPSSNSNLQHNLNSSSSHPSLFPFTTTPIAHSYSSLPLCRNKSCLDVFLSPFFLALRPDVPNPLILIDSLFFSRLWCAFAFCHAWISWRLRRGQWFGFNLRPAPTAAEQICQARAQLWLLQSFKLLWSTFAAAAASPTIASRLPATLRHLSCAHAPREQPAASPPICHHEPGRTASAVHPRGQRRRPKPRQDFKLAQSSQVQSTTHHFHDLPQAACSNWHPTSSIA